MKILYVVPYVPGPIYVRPYNLIRSLAKLGHRVTVLTMSANEHDRQAIKNLGGACEQVFDFPLPVWRSLSNCVLALPTRTPLQAAYCWNPELIRFARESLYSASHQNQFDLIHVEHLRGSRLGLALKDPGLQVTRNGTKTPPIVWDSVDCITYLFGQTARMGGKRSSRLMAKFELGRTSRYEAWLVGQFDHVLVTSQTDKDALLSLPQAAAAPPDISVVPNGVDLDVFSPDPSLPKDHNTLIISGKMSYHANVAMALHMVKEIMPLVWSRRADVKVWIVGKNPAREVQALAQNPLITVTGTVDDLSLYLKRAAVAVAPLRYGAGIQNKVLEAMACSTPVVTNSSTLKSLGAVPGKDVLVADNPEEFSRQVLYLLGNDNVRREVGQAGRRYVESHHNWEKIAAGLEKIYRHLMV